jgi:hypothetical protein
MTSLVGEQLGSQMNNFAMMFILTKQTKHSISILESCLDSGRGQRLILDGFDIPITVISDDKLYNAQPITLTYCNINAPLPEVIFNLVNNENYIINEGLFHYYVLDNLENIDYLRDKIFKFKDAIVRRGNEIMNQIKTKKQIVSLHVRRTDGLYPLPIAYYETALSYFNSNDFDVIVMSDDIQYCKLELKTVLQNYTVYFCEDTTNYIDMYLMTICNANIISNSAFSLWGALLNKSENDMILPASMIPTVINQQRMCTYKKINTLTIF